MIKRLLPIVILAAPLFAATPQIVNVDPIFLPTAGGALVVTYTEGLSRVCPGFTELCGPFPSIDGQTVAVVGRDLAKGQLTILAPAHAPGAAVLTLAGTSGDSISTNIHYKTGDDFERVLLPLIPQETPGANGSLWVADTKAINAGPDPVVIEAPFIKPAGISPSLPTPHTPPGGLAPPFWISRMFDGTDGVFAYVPRFASADVAFGSRVSDVSRQSQTWGTEIPIVRERDFRANAVLLDLPGDPRFRITLRAYEFGYAPDQLRIRVFELFSNTLLFEDLRLTSGILPIIPIDIPSYPAYLQMPIDVHGPERLRIEVRSEFGSKVWAMASVTNNETQHVTVISSSQ